MLVAPARRREGLSIRAEHRDWCGPAATTNDATNAGEPQLQPCGKPPDCRALPAARCEDQLVVVAAGENRRARSGAVEVALRDRRDRHAPKLDFGRHPRALADVAEIGDETVGHVDGAARDPAQRPSQRDAGLRRIEPGLQRPTIARRHAKPPRDERERGITERS